ncbi:Mg2+-importing ATPase [Streptacidiphilus sp. BW17]|uniref:HAD-IC family P-type ATPase n=1 Tax=Streptacidiphilus sp. BW17 TaxID=3156274 RepID=UPI003519A6F7
MSALSELTDLQVLRALGTSRRGLPEETAELWLAAHGENTLPLPPRPTRTRRVALLLRDPYTMTLCLLAGATAVSGAFTSTAVLLLLITAGCALRLVGELRAERETAALRRFVDVGSTATVLRRRPAPSPASRSGSRSGSSVERELPFDQFVPGDVVRLVPGDRVPADLLLLRAEGLTVDQALLTGVSQPVPKRAAGRGGAVRTGRVSPDNARLCLRGSVVAHGTGVGVVLATGADTFLAGANRAPSAGANAASSAGARAKVRACAGSDRRPGSGAGAPAGERRTAFDGTAREVSGLLLRLALVSGAAGLLVGALVDGHRWEALPYAAAVGVGLTPEMLLLVVTAALARQAAVLRRGPRGRVFARRLTAVHDLGALDVVCIDKTGTLTRDRLTLRSAVDATGRPDPEVLRWAAVNSLICAELGDPPELDAVDDALLAAAEAGSGSAASASGSVLDGLDGLGGPGGLGPDEDFAAGLVGVAALPFDPGRRVATVVVAAQAGPGLTLSGAQAAQALVAKGAVEEILARCGRVRAGAVPPSADPAERADHADHGDPAERADPAERRTGGLRLVAGRHQHSTGPPELLAAAVELDDDRRAGVLELADRLAGEGLRVLAVAVSGTRPRAGAGRRPAAPAVADLDGLTLLGLVALADEPDPSAAAALTELTAEGIAVKIVTGDRAGAAVQACRDVGLDPGAPLLGPDVDALDDADLRRAVESTVVFALAAPAQKARIVSALRANGHVVGFLGDGLNDLPALRAADVGIGSPGALDEGPRSSADLVLAAPGLTVLGDAVRSARTALANVGNYLRITLASNLGNVLAMLAAGALVPFLPMLPAQVLTQNLCFDAAQLALAFDQPLAAGPGGRADKPAGRGVQRPRPLRRGALARYALLVGVVNALADLATFAVLLATAHGRTGAHEELLFHSGWFTENLITQALTVHLLRVPGGAQGRPRATWPVRLANGGLAVVGLLLPATPFGAALGLGVLPLGFYPLLGAVLVGYAALLLATRRWLRAHPAWSAR